MLGQVVVLAAIGLIDWINALLLGGNAVAPAADVLGQVLRARRLEGVLACGMVLVSVHATARRVDDEDAALPRVAQQLVHTRGHLADTANGVETVVRIPHVADDDRCLLGVPLGRLNDGVKSAAAGSSFDTLAKRQR